MDKPALRKAKYTDLVAVRLEKDQAARLEKWIAATKLPRPVALRRLLGEAPRQLKAKDAVKWGS